MYIKKLFLTLLLVFSCFGCENKNTYPKDFWNQTIEAIENWDAIVDKEKWNLGIQKEEYAEDKNHRSLTVRFTDVEKPDEKMLFSFQNQGNEYVYYRFEKHFEEHVNLYYTSAYDHKIEIKSVDSNFKQYKITYTVDEYRNEVYFETRTMEGKIESLTDGTITYDLVPYLSTAIDSLNKMLNEFEKDFLIDYDTYEFIHLPKLMNDLFIPSKTELEKEEINTLNYYSKDRINAKGYRIVTFVKLSKDYSAIQYGEYCVEQGAYGFKYNVQLRPRTIENCFDILLTNDPDEQYAVYIKDNTAYLYLQSYSDDFILNDVMKNNAENSKCVLFEGKKNF